MIKIHTKITENSISFQPGQTYHQNKLTYLELDLKWGQWLHHKLMEIQMDNKKYSEEVLRTDDPDYDRISQLLSDKKYIRIVHAIMGISGEAGEISDIVKKVIVYGKKFDKSIVEEECGDLLWYMSILLDEIGSSFNKIMQQNIEKLKKRYPKGFSESLAIERKDKK